VAKVNQLINPISSFKPKQTKSDNFIDCLYLNFELYLPY